MMFGCKTVLLETDPANRLSFQVFETKELSQGKLMGVHVEFSSTEVLLV